MPLWFLPPDFTYRKDGAIRLGTVLEHPLRPLSILASEGNGLPADLDLPEEESIVERNHEHPREAGVSIGMKLWSAFRKVASTGAEMSVDRSRVHDFGKVDHEVWAFNRELSDRCLEGIVSVPKVRKYMDSALFGRKPVYIITGVRITKTSFAVSTQSNATVSAQTSTSTSDPTNTTPFTAGGDGNMRVTNTAGDSYETAPNILFAYRVHIIRDAGSGEIKEDLFSHKKAFMTGTSDLDIECLEVSPQAFQQGINESLEVHEQSIGDDDSWVSVPLSFSGCN
ncbi:hypothetical protein MferCBS31731_002280 [Microsporum ferrugineum]